VWVDGPLIRAMEEGVPLFVDEIGLVSPKVLSLLYAAMDGRQEIRITANPERGIVKAKPGFMVVAATNPHAPGVRLSEALLSRFVCQAEMNTDWDVARRLGLQDNVAAAMENLDKKRTAGEIAGSPQMREALAFIKTSAVFGQELALANLVAASQENDRDVIADVLSRALGAKVEALALD
jgi:MoxR-like ATPase